MQIHINESGSGQRGRSFEVAAHPGLTVRTFDELQEYVARVAYKNPAYDVFLRGQTADYDDPTSRGKTMLLPTLFRRKGGGRAAPAQVARRLQALSDFATKVPRFQKIEGVNALKQHQVAVWALVQHYNLAPTPLLDVTRSARVASCFALADGKASDRYIYAFGLPYAFSNISMHYSEETMILNLRTLMSPQARRPHFQEGYLVGSLPTMAMNSKNSDLARRLLAKFRIPYDCASSFFPKGNPAIDSKYLLPEDDPISEWLNSIPEVKTLRSLEG